MSSSSDLNMSAAVAFQDLEGINVNPGQATAIEKHAWSDEKLRQLCSNISLPPKYIEHSSQRAALIRFINFYCGGVVPEGYRAYDIIAAAIMCMPTENASKAADVLFTTSGPVGKSVTQLYHLDPVSAPGEETLKGEASLKPHEVIQEYGGVYKIDHGIETGDKDLPGSAGSAPNSNPLIHNYTRTECSSFLDSARKTLESTGADSAQGQGMISLRRVCGYLALTFLRAIVKDCSQMTVAFSKTQFRRNLLGLIFDQSREGSYSPTCSDAVKKAIDAMLKNHLSPRLLFAFVVQKWIEFQASSNTWATSIIAATVLTHTAYNGLQLFHMMTEVSRHYSISWIAICEALFFDSTEVTVKRIVMFLKTYMKHGSQESSYPWVRIIDDAYMTEYSARNNFHFCAILAGIVETSQDNPGVWEANWVKTRMAEVEELKFIATAFCEKYSMTLSDLKATEKSKPILEKAMRLKQESKRTTNDKSGDGIRDDEF